MSTTTATPDRPGSTEHRGPALRAPFFEIGPKSRLRLAPLQLLARAAGRAGVRDDVHVVLTVPVALIGPLHAAGSHVHLFAQSMDPDPMGDGVGRVFAESLVDAGAAGVMLNHDAQPLDPATLEASVSRAHGCGLSTIVCAATEQQVLEYAELEPTAILFEPPALIGTATTEERAWIRPIDEAIRRAHPDVLMMHAGGVSSPAVAGSIMRAGADATGSTSGVLSAADPLNAASEFIAATRRGWDDASVGHQQRSGSADAAGEGGTP